MPTPEQVEAVARAQYHSINMRISVSYLPWEELPDKQQRFYLEDATAGIAAYERARPKVPSDRELVQVFLEAKEARFRQGHSSSYDDNEAGIRAVRERLERDRS